jgi:hypothetical protein
VAAAAGDELPRMREELIWMDRVIERNLDGRFVAKFLWRLFGSDIPPPPAAGFRIDYAVIVAKAFVRKFFGPGSP